MADEKLIELNKVYKSYGSLKVLEDISLQVFKGEIVSIIGPSGCGKTTILNMIAGIISPDEGQIWVDENKRMGYVFQESRLIPWKNVEKNIWFVQKNYSFDKKKARKIREELLRLAGMERYTSYFPSQLSGGMRQKVNLIRALCIFPDILLLDEPFKSMDRKSALVLEEVILSMMEKRIQGVLMVTFDFERAIRMSSKIYFLSKKPTRVMRILERPFCQEIEEEKEKGTDFLEKMEQFSLRREKMYLRTIIKKLGLKNLTPELGEDVKIKGCHISDIMSEVLANASEGDIWLTRQNNPVVIALASLKRIPAILLVDGRKPLPEMLDKAKEEKIVVLTTPMSYFEVAGRLYQMDFSRNREPVFHN